MSLRALRDKGSSMTLLLHTRKRHPGDYFTVVECLLLTEGDCTRWKVPRFCLYMGSSCLPAAARRLRFQGLKSQCIACKCCIGPVESIHPSTGGTG